MAGMAGHETHFLRLGGPKALAALEMPRGRGMLL